ncbi:helix-turn-helix domain-containing protein [Paracoccus fontiphilus]|uniref:Helix-turn-helix domain-containing protein n=1 Tax=Paracoccus fontiphilus TaxID=1815556 RepID=A0ABV7IHI4_9RHOB|nr:helix-turn-helix domain-containing protein [Paracoccus fontiphilus]
MSFRLVEMVLESAIEDATEVAVLIALASHADKFFSCYPSIARLCKLSRYKERAVQGAIKRLAERGVITVKTGGGRGGTSFYTINPAALKPAADAPFQDDKPRSKNTVSDDKTPQQMRETPHLTTENPAADADEPSQEPVKNHAARAHEGEKSDRILSLRAGLLDAMGLTGSELNTSAVFPVRSMSPAELQLSLDVWTKDGLTDQQIIAAVSAKMQAERERDGSFLPKSVRFFDGAISDHAKRLSRPAGRGASTATAQAETPEQRSRRRRRLIGG